MNFWAIWTRISDHTPVQCKHFTNTMFIKLNLQLNWQTSNILIKIKMEKPNFSLTSPFPKIRPEVQPTTSPGGTPSCRSGAKLSFCFFNQHWTNKIECYYAMTSKFRVKVLIKRIITFKEALHFFMHMKVMHSWKWCTLTSTKAMKAMQL